MLGNVRKRTADYDINQAHAYQEMDHVKAPVVELFTKNLSKNNSQCLKEYGRM